MASGYPLCVNQIPIRSSEALYQACRFPHMPEVQHLIIKQTSPMTAKMVSKPYRSQSRDDWMRVRVKVMRWSLRVKLAQNFQSFSQLLLETGDLPIVEKSFKDGYWGAKPTNDGTLVGMNVLGRLLMELREELKSGQFGKEAFLEPLEIPNFLLAEKLVEPITIKQKLSPTVQQHSLFETTPYIPKRASSMNENSTLQVYSQYKKSGAEWLGEVPTEWKIFKSKRVFTQRTERAKPDDEQLSATQAYGVILQEEYEEKIGRKVTKIQFHLEKRKHVKLDDFVISMRSFQGGLERAYASGCIRSSYVVLKPLMKIHPDFYTYLFKSQRYIEALQTTASFIRDGQDLNFDNFSKVDLVLPPYEQQVVIGDFLQKKTTQIDEAIAIKQQQIALLKERKQIIIQQAVTRGLDPDVPMKDSGVEWIGEIPKHWKVSRLKNVLAEPLKYGANESGVTYSPNLIRYIRITDFSGEGKLSEDKKLSLPWSVGAKYLLKDGDILLARSGATVGKSYQFKESMSGDRNFCFAGYLIKAVANESTITSDYLFLYLGSMCFDKWKNLIFNKATIENIGADKYSVLPVILPPIDEQIAILNSVSSSLIKIYQAIKQQQQQIEKLKEYKATLINSAVTGKIKVPELIH